MTRSTVRSSASTSPMGSSGSNELDRGAHRVCDRCLSRVAPHDHAHERESEAGVRQVNRRLRRRLQVPSLGVADDAHNRHPRLRVVRIATDGHALADGILPGPLTIRKRLVHDRNARALTRVRELDVASSQQRDSHRLKEARRHRREVRNRTLGTCSRRCALNDIAAGSVGATKRQWESQPGS